MKKIYFLLVCMMLGILGILSCNKDEDIQQDAISQPSYSLGCELLPQAEYEALPKAEMPQILKALDAIVNLNTPPVGDQGGEGSCVAWGTTYAGRSMDWAYKTNTSSNYGFGTNIFSPEFVYNQIKVGTCASGAYVISGLNLIKTKGVVPWTEMPYTDATCSTLPNATQTASALNYRISSWGTVAIDVTTIKTYLAANKPVIVAGPVDRKFMYLAPNAVLTKRSGSLGGHCYCVVGYDDAKNAFKFINSWGTGWATAGYGYINYKNIKNWWTEAYTITTL